MALVWSCRSFVAAAALLLGAGSALAQTEAAATATASAQIIDPVGISAAAAGSAAAASAAGSAGPTQVSAGTYAVRGPANAVVSVAVTLPSSMDRVGGGGRLALSAAPPHGSPALTSAGDATFEAAGAASTLGAPGGLYAGVAQVTVNLN